MTNEAPESGEIVASAPAAMELQSIGTAELRAQLDQAIGMTEEAIVRVATIWAELTRRGEDMSGVRFSLARFMTPVARGRLLPGLVVAMSGQTRALDRIAQLPLPDQERLARGEEIAIFRSSGMVRAPLSDLTYSEISFAIRDGRILEAEEQRIAWVRSQMAKAPRKRSSRMPKVSISTDRIVRIGNARIPADRLIVELRAAGLLE